MTPGLTESGGRTVDGRETGLPDSTCVQPFVLHGRTTTDSSHPHSTTMTV